MVTERARTYRVYGDKIGGGTCRGCGQQVVWAETLSGKMIPIDGKVLDLAPLRTYHDGEFIGARLVYVLDSSINPSHFSTCPKASKFRR